MGFFSLSCEMQNADKAAQQMAFFVCRPSSDILRRARHAVRWLPSGDITFCEMDKNAKHGCFFHAIVWHFWKKS